MQAGATAGAPALVAAEPRPAACASAGAAVDDAAGQALRLEGLSLSFGGIAALADVDLAVRDGEIRAIIGPNGAGKSSLINLISGIYRPDSGRIRLGGRAFKAVPTQKLAALGVARTFQNLALFPGLDVLENVAIGLTYRLGAGPIGQVLGLPLARRAVREAQGAAAEILTFLHLSAMAHRPVATLPYGLQKRVELARALIARPRLLLLDEPMAGMSAAEKREMSDFIRDARDRLGTTIVLIEHDIGVVMALSDRIAVLDHGCKIADGLPAEIRSDPAVIDAYLGVDHSNHGSGSR